MNNSKINEISVPQGLNNKNPDVKILWTGGQDSSYRMVQLSKYHVSIQPIYLCDNRQSEQHELNAIGAITADIEKHPDTKCTILPLVKFKVSDIPPDTEISEAFERLHKLSLIGSQYNWLAKFAKGYEGLELCFEKGLTNKLYILLIEKGSMSKIIHGDITYARLDKDKSDPDLFKIFGAFHIPLPLWEITKLEEIEEFKKLGFEDTLHKTWFCHKPINNKPCGICNPCKDVVKEGLSFRLTSNALKRYHTEIKYGDTKWFKNWKKIRVEIVGY